MDFCSSARVTSKPQPAQLDRQLAFLQGLHRLVQHSEEGGGRGEVDHCRRDRHEQRVGRAHDRQRDGPQGRWRIEDDDVEVIADRRDPFSEPVQQIGFSPGDTRRQLVFGGIQVQVGRDQIEPIPVGLPHRVGETFHLRVTEEPIERVRFLNVEIGHVAEQCRAGALTVAVDQANPVSLDGKILGKVARHRGLADPALEILHRNHR